MTSDIIIKIGSLFALSVFWHFFADWVPQTHKEAMAKAGDRVVRAWHCVKYTVVMITPFVCFGMGSWWNVLWASLILGVSHYIIDSYVPVMLWAKWFRQHPSFKELKRTFPTSTDIDAFKAMAGTPIGLILIITMDQLFHIAFLLPVCALMAIYGM